ncbi:MAG: hypothetical protein EXR70_23260 [Deltaproteobacteria bacterium]|nr:hypothetical protein [Deltaproteobacteria bacterium]
MKLFSAQRCARKFSDRPQLFISDFEFGLLPSGRMRQLLDHLELEVLGNNHLDVLVDRINVASEAPCPAHRRFRQAIAK